MPINDGKYIVAIHNPDKDTITLLTLNDLYGYKSSYMKQKLKEWYRQQYLPNIEYWSNLDNEQFEYELTIHLTGTPPEITYIGELPYLVYIEYIKEQNKESKYRLIELTSKR